MSKEKKQRKRAVLGLRSAALTARSSAHAAAHAAAHDADFVVNMLSGKTPTLPDLPWLGEPEEVAALSLPARRMGKLGEAALPCLVEFDEKLRADIARDIGEPPPGGAMAGDTSTRCHLGAGEGQDQQEEVTRLAGQAAARYARRVFWAEYEELRQEAMVAGLCAKRTWDAQCGLPFGPYVWRACMLHLRAWCWRNSSPVYAPHHKLKELAGVHRAEVPEDCAITNDDPHTALADMQWRANVREQVDFLLDRLGADSGVAARIIVLEESPAKVAYENEMHVADAYRAARMGRRLLTDNAMLHALLKERGT